MDTWGRFTEPKLPPKEAFYSKLSDAHISDEDYTHAQKVWATFGCKTLGDYSDLYCRTDVLLLADVPEDVPPPVRPRPRTLLHQPGPYMGRPTQKDRSGARAAHRLWPAPVHREGDARRYLNCLKAPCQANNPLVDGYDPEKPSSHILYLDANNIYGWAMSLPLTTGAFRWEEDCEQLAKTIADHPADDSEGFILEVDLEYPEDLHNAHNAYPLAPERMVVQKKWMSEYQHNLLGVWMAPTEVEKLVLNLRNKVLYMLHYRNLQLYTSLGMRQTKSIAPSGSTKALGWSHTSGWIQSSGRRPPTTLRRT